MDLVMLSFALLVGEVVLGAALCARLGAWEVLGVVAVVNAVWLVIAWLLW